MTEDVPGRRIAAAAAIEETPADTGPRTGPPPSHPGKDSRWFTWRS
jgi:hypothetical protein